MLKKVRSTVSTYQMLEPGDEVVVGVSGGSDSVGLLEILLGLDEFHLRIVVAHVNHGLRKEEAKRDAAFVEKLAVDHNLTFEYRKVDTLKYSRQKKLSIEEAGRELRYEFFEDVLNKHGATKIATAHTINDQAETVLLRLIRGTGTAGLSAILPRTSRIIRPLLYIERDDIREFLRGKNISWVEDSSNYSDVYLRNRVRREVIPLLKDINPQINSSLSNLSLISAADIEYIDSVAQRIASEISMDMPFGLVGNVLKYRAEHKALRMSMLRYFITRVRGDLRGITFRHILSSDELVTADKSSGKATLSRGLVLARGYDYFCLAKKDDLAMRFSYIVSGPGEWKLSPELAIRIEEVDEVDEEEMQDENVGYFSADKLRFPLEVVSFTEGDRFIPLGMNEHKKLKNLFIDCKIPRFFRNRVPVFKSGGEIFWVGGVRIDERFRVREEDRKVIKISLLKSRFRYADDSFQFL